MQIDFSKQLMHDSAKEEYRKPLGAVTAGTCVRLSLAVRDLYFKKIYLTLVADETEENIPMQQDENGIWWAEYETPSVPCVLWYWFCIRMDEDTSIYYGAHSGYKRHRRGLLEPAAAVPAHRV